MAESTSNKVQVSVTFSFSNQVVPKLLSMLSHLFNLKVTIPKFALGLILTEQQ